MTAITTRDSRADYTAKTVTADDAVRAVTSHSAIALGQAVGQPPALMAALAKRARRGEVDDVRMYYYHAEEAMSRELLQYDLMDRLHPYTMFMQKAERDLITRAEADGHDRKLVSFVPTSFGQSVRTFADNIDVDVFLVQVSPMDSHGFFTFGTNNDYSSSVARQARHLIVEVNPNMPRVFGQSALHVSEVDAIVEHASELPSLSPRPPRDNEAIIGEHIAELVPDHATLQIGVGGLPDAVCAALADRTGLGVHTEVLGPGLAALIASGAADGRHKQLNRGKAVFAFAMGDTSFYEFLNDNQAIESWPVDYVNDPATIARNDNVVSINSTIEMDLTGACNSEWMNGHQFSASGGQLDFVRGAYASRGGKSFIAFESSAKNGAISKIVPRLSGPVTTPRNDVQYVATEQGIVNLRGLSSTERANALITLAHPSFREQLTEQARSMHLV